MNERTQYIDQLFRYYYRPLCLYALHYVNQIDQAEDIVQDCFSLLWEKMNEGEAEIENAQSYLYAMVKNRSLNYLRKESVFDLTLSLSDLEELPEEELEERSAIEARMWTAIDALPDRCREVFLLNKREGLTYKEISERFHISIHTVDNHIRKAMRLIREGACKAYVFFFN